MTEQTQESTAVEFAPDEATEAEVVTAEEGQEQPEPTLFSPTVAGDADELTRSDLDAELGTDTGVVTSDVAEAEEATEAGAETSEPPETPKPAAESTALPTDPKGVQRRIDRAVRGQRAAEREVAALKAQLGQAPPAESPPTDSAPAPVQPEGAEPQEADFADFDQYQRALARHDARQEAQEAVRSALAAYDQQHATQQAADAAETERLDLMDTLEDVRVQGREKYGTEAFDQAIEKQVFPNGQAALVLDSEHAAELAYHLGTHPEEAQAIIALGDPVAMARAYGRLEAHITQPPPVRSTTAPPPGSRVSGQATVQKSPDTMTQAEYEAWRAGGGGQ